MEYQPPMTDTNQMVRLMNDFTETYRQTSSTDVALREALCYRIQWKGMVRPIQDEDLFAGRLIQNPIGFTGQTEENSLGYYLHRQAVNELQQDMRLSSQSKKVLSSLVDFWESETTEAKAKRAFPPGMKKALPSDLYYAESGIAFSLWRMSGIQLNYRKLVTLGIPGLKEEVKAHRRKAMADPASLKLYEAMLMALDAFCEIGLFYAAMAAEMAGITADRPRKKELMAMARILQTIVRKKPSTFREGLQLLYLYNIVDGARNYGRMDDSLGDLYQADLQAGRIDEEEAIRLLSSIWMLMRDRHYRYDTRLIIGGRGRVNEDAADKLALLIMETSNRVREIVPQVALRFYRGQNPALYRKGLDVLASGYTFPMLYNDDINIPAVQKAFEVPYEEAVHAIQYGCGEYVLNHRSVGTPSGVINLLQALLVTMNHGLDPFTEKPMGMARERFSRYNDFRTFDDLLNAYREQVEYHVEQLAMHEELEYEYAGKDNAYLYTSLLMDDCIERGKAVFSGGIRYLGGTLETYGNANTSDSLVAIRELVYDKKAFTLPELMKMLKANFKGFGKERQMMLGSPKYGNDDEAADAMMMVVHNHICLTTRKQKDTTGLHSYLVVVINNDANTVMGRYTPASPDGRLAFTPMNPGNNPAGGADKSGVTAFLNSLIKPDPGIHAGAVQNMKFSKELFTHHRPKLEALLQTYFATGGTQAMLTVVSRHDLEEAIIHPEKYQKLIVRVGGFSERFVNLPPDTQQEVLSRTLY